MSGDRRGGAGSGRAAKRCFPRRRGPACVSAVALWHLTFRRAGRDFGTDSERFAQTRDTGIARVLNKSVDAWRALLDYGIERRDLSHNPAAAMKKLPLTHTEMQTYTPGEIQRVLHVADTDRNGHLWYLALSGLRCSEIAGLRWADIDLDKKTVNIARGRLQTGAGNVVEKEPKTRYSRRVLPLDDGLVSVLRRASACYAQEKLALGAAHRDSGYVAVNQAGEPYTPDTLNRMWHRLTRAAGVRQIRLHDARHSCGTAMHLRGFRWP
jgi:integrase